MRACQAPDDLAGPVVPGGLHVLHKVIPGQRGEEHGAGTGSPGLRLPDSWISLAPAGKAGPTLSIYNKGNLRNWPCRFEGEETEGRV